MKGGELEKRSEKRAEAAKELAAAEEKGDQENIDKFSKRLEIFRGILLVSRSKVHFLVYVRD